MGPIILVPTYPRRFWWWEYFKWCFLNIKNGEVGKNAEKCHFGRLQGSFFMGKDSSLQVRTTFFSFLWFIFKENVLLSCPGSCLRLPFNSEGTFGVKKLHFYGKYPQNNQKLTFFLTKYKFILYSVHLKKLLHLSIGLITKTENNFIIAVYSSRRQYD